MTDFEWACAIAGTAVFAGVAIAVAVRMLRLMRGGDAPLLRNRDGSFNTACAVCGARADVRPESLARLSAAEKALVVRERPEAIGKNLVEFVCPECDAAHCFSLGRASMQLIGVNLYEGQHFQVQCKECRKPLEPPPWPLGAYDGAVNEAPGELDDFGLQCPFCGAVTCVACCRTTTRNRTGDGSLLCPRCYRGPLERFYHPAAHARRNQRTPQGING